MALTSSVLKIDANCEQWFAASVVPPQSVCCCYLWIQIRQIPTQPLVNLMQPTIIQLSKPGTHKDVPNDAVDESKINTPSLIVTFKSIVAIGLDPSSESSNLSSRVSTCRPKQPTDGNFMRQAARALDGKRPRARPYPVERKSIRRRERERESMTSKKPHALI